MGGETFRTVGKILADIEENKMPEVSYKDIVSKHVNEDEHNLIGNRRGRKRKRVRGGGNFETVKKKTKRDRVIKRDILY